MENKANLKVWRTGVGEGQYGVGSASEPGARDLFSICDVRKRWHGFIPSENVLCLAYNHKRCRLAGARHSIAA